MTEAEWLACDDPIPMLEFLGVRASARKLRLSGCGCGRRLIGLLADQTAITRLFYQLGWTKGRQPHVHGELKGEGIPVLNRCKKEEVRLARKYDTPPQSTPRRDGLAEGMAVTINSPGCHLHGRTATVVALRPRRMPIVRIDDRNYRGRIA